MESIIFFVIAIAINLVFKSANDKKKIEQARKKRVEQLGNNPTTNRADKVQSKTMTDKNMKSREILIAKDREKERENRIKERNNYNPGKYNYTIQEVESKKSTGRENYAERDNLERLKREKEELKAKQLEAQKEIRKGFEKKRLVNAIIWSEILGDPKSIQNLKKGM